MSKQPIFDSEGKFISSKWQQTSKGFIPKNVAESNDYKEKMKKQRLDEKIAKKKAHQEEMKHPMQNFYIFFAGGDENDTIELGVQRARTEEMALRLWWKNSNEDEREAIGNDKRAIQAIPVIDAKIVKKKEYEVERHIVHELTEKEKEQRDIEIRKATEELAKEKERQKAWKVKQDREYKIKLKNMKPEDNVKYDREAVAKLLAISNMGGEGTIEEALNSGKDIKFAEQRWFESLAEGSRDISTAGTDNYVVEEVRAEKEANKIFDSEIASWRKRLRVMTDKDIDKALDYHPENWKKLIDKPYPVEGYSESKKGKTEHSKNIRGINYV